MKHTPKILPALVLLLGAAPAASAQGATPDGTVQSDRSDRADQVAPDGTDGSDAAEALAAAAPVVMLRMRSGHIYWGSILGHDPERLRFRLLDTGGVARVPWGMLDPVHEHELRLKYGYVDTTDDELLVTADRLVLRDGTEVIGKIIARTGDEILIKTDKAIFPVPKTQVAGAATKVQVPALDIYTREELYSQQLVMADLESPESLFALGQHCERILDYVHAVEHYKAIVVLDPEFRRDDVAVAVARTEQRAQRQEEIDYLAEIEHKRKRKKYDDALALIEAFPERYPDSPLYEDLQKRRLRVERSIKKDLEREVVRRWHYWTGKVARSMASPEHSLEEVLNFADEQMSEEILARVTQDMKRITVEIEPQDVRSLWSQREGGRWLRASYGHGTWLLGEEAALAGGPEQGEAEEEVSGRAAERADFEEKIARWLKNQEAVRKAKRNVDDSEDQALFWSQFSTPSRYQWILAHYVENSGDMTVRSKPEFQACRQCGGTGVREILVTGSAANLQNREAASAGSRLVKCPTCHHIGIVRRVRYR